MQGAAPKLPAGVGPTGRVFTPLPKEGLICRFLCAGIRVELLIFSRNMSANVMNIWP